MHKFMDKVWDKIIHLKLQANINFARETFISKSPRLWPNLSNLQTKLQNMSCSTHPCSDIIHVLTSSMFWHHSFLHNPTSWPVVLSHKSWVTNITMVRKSLATDIIRSEHAEVVGENWIILVSWRIMAAMYIAYCQMLISSGIHDISYS